MNKFLILAIILFSFTFTFAQGEKPIAQAEYVKMLFEIQKAPAKKQALIESIRKRGIAFILTDGIRGLTRSKSGNDIELLKTLEESNKRRENPNSAKLPDAKESAEILEKTRQNTLQALAEMPDFVAKQFISRGISYAGTNKFQSLDQLVVAVSLSTEKGEQYKLLAVNGVEVKEDQKGSYRGTGGSTTIGEFSKDLERIFKAESKTEFKLLDTNTLRLRNTLVYEYEILLANNKDFVIASGGIISDTAVLAGMKGKIWIDRELGRVIRMELQATDMPSSFPVKKFESATDYDWAEIGGEKYLLPIQSDARFTILSSGEMLQTKNLIRFRQYQKFGSEVRVLDDDVIEEEKPKDN